MAAGGGICPAIKPLLDTVVREASHILNLSEALGSGHPNQDLQQTHIQPPGSSVPAFHGSCNFRKAISAQPPYHVSPHNASLLYEMDTLKRELYDVQHRHQIIVDELQRAAECGNINLELTHQQDQSRGQDKMQLFEQKLHVPNGKPLYLNQYLLGTGEQIFKDKKSVPSAVVDLKPDKTKIDFKKEDNMQILHHAVKTSKLSEEADITALRMRLGLSEKEIMCLQSELRVSDMKSKSLEEQLVNAEQKVQSMHDRLITTNDKAINLEEALRASGEVMQSLRKSLQEREIEAGTAKDQLQLLQQHNLEHQKTIKKMSSSLGASEKLYRKRLPELETGLKNYKMQVEFLQDTLRGAESTHKEKIEELTNEMEKQTMHLQYLQGQVLDLSKKLLKEQQRVRKLLGGSVKYEECVQTHMQEARHGDMTQNDHQSYAMDNLSRRGQAETTTENLLQYGVQKNSHAYEPGQGERPLQAGLNSLREEFVELRKNLYEVFKHSGETEDQRRLDWMKVLERSQEWEKRAGKLIDSMFYVHDHHMHESKRGCNDGTSVTGRPLSYTYSPEVVHHKKNIRTQSWPWNSPMPDLEQRKHYQFHSSNETRHSDSMRPQKHFKDAQTVGFHMDTHGSLRMS